MEAAGGALQQGGLGARMDDFRRELADPAREIARREMRQIDDRQRAAADLAKLADVAARWQDEAGAQFRKNMADTAGVTGSPVNSALQRFDAMPRWQRLQASLLEGEKGPAAAAPRREARRAAFRARRRAPRKKLWESTAGTGANFAGFSKPAAETTDLASPIEAARGERPRRRGARRGGAFQRWPAQ